MHQISVWEYACSLYSRLACSDINKDNKSYITSAPGQAYLLWGLTINGLL
jgi:hypothetical protein